MDRKSFIEKTLGIMLIAIPAYGLVGCSSSDDNSEDPDPNPNPNGQANCLSNGSVSSIGSNHGHRLTVSAAAIQNGSQRSYSIQGTSGHDHMVTLTAADFTNLQSNNSITVNSTNDDGHSHSVTVRCA